MVLLSTTVSEKNKKTLVGLQAITQLLVLFLSFCNSIGGECKVKKLTGEDKGIAYQLPSQAK